MHWNMYYGHEGLFVGLAPVTGCYGKWHIDVESLKCSLGILTKTACFSLGCWSNREDNISFQLIKPDFSCFCFVFFCHCCCCCCGKTTHPPGSASVGCRCVSHHRTISSGLSWMHPTSLHPCYGFDAGVTCLLFFISQVGCWHLTCFRWGQKLQPGMMVTQRQHQLLAPSKAQALSGNLLTSFFHFHHLMPCLSASSDETTAGHYRNQPGLIIQI